MAFKPEKLHKAADAPASGSENFGNKAGDRGASEAPISRPELDRSSIVDQSAGMPEEDASARETQARELLNEAIRDNARHIPTKDTLDSATDALMEIQNSRERSRALSEFVKREIASDFLFHAADVIEKIEDPRERFERLFDLHAALKRWKSNPLDRHELFEAAERAAELVDDPNFASEGRRRLALMAAEIDYDSSTRIAERIADPEIRVRAFMQLGSDRRHGRVAGAEELFERARAAIAEIGDATRRETLLHELDELPERIEQDRSSTGA